jgi:hypothetical protein
MGPLQAKFIQFHNCQALSDIGLERDKPDVGLGPTDAIPGQFN